MARSPRRAPIASLLHRSLWLGFLLAFGVAACNLGGSGTGSGEPEVAVRLDRVVIDDHDSPVIVLEEEGGSRWLPIWIGPAEAHSIALQIEQQRLPRPNTHDLACSVIHLLKGRVSSVVVTELRGGTYYALLKLDVDGESVEVDARPSDAIAIALRDDAPIFVREGLFRQADASAESPPEDEETAPKRSI